MPCRYCPPTVQARKLALVPDDSHHVSIAEGEILVVVSDLTLSVHSVGLGEPFDSSVFVFNKTEGTISKAIGVFFGVYDPETGSFDDYFGWAGNAAIPPGHSEWIIPCTGVELGIWDAFACVGSIGSFYPEHCLGFQDILSVY